MTERDEVRELRATIEAISGHKPVSYKLKHLRRRMAMLVPAQTVNGHDLISGVGDIRLARAIIEAIGAPRAMLVTQIAAPKKQNPIDIIIRAIDEYAVRQGYGVLVERIKKAK